MRVERDPQAQVLIRAKDMAQRAPCQGNVLSSCFNSNVFGAVLSPGELEEQETERELLDLGNTLLMTKENHPVFITFL